MNSVQRRNDFKNYTGKFPPRPVISRWGTYINSVKFYFENFDIVKLYLLNCKENDKNLGQLKIIFQYINIEKQLLCFYDFYDIFS